MTDKEKLNKIREILNVEIREYKPSKNANTTYLATKVDCATYYKIDRMASKSNKPIARVTRELILKGLKSDEHNSVNRKGS